MPDPLREADMKAFRVMAQVALLEEPADSLAKNFLRVLDSLAAPSGGGLCEKCEGRGEVAANLTGTVMMPCPYCAPSGGERPEGETPPQSQAAMGSLSELIQKAQDWSAEMYRSADEVERLFDPVVAEGNRECARTLDALIAALPAQRTAPPDGEGAPERSRQDPSSPSKGEPVANKPGICPDCGTTYCGGCTPAPVPPGEGERVSDERLTEIARYNYAHAGIEEGQAVARELLALRAPSSGGEREALAIALEIAGTCALSPKEGTPCPSEDTHVSTWCEPCRTVDRMMAFAERLAALSQAPIGSDPVAWRERFARPKVLADAGSWILRRTEDDCHDDPAWDREPLFTKETPDA